MSARRSARAALPIGAQWIPQPVLQPPRARGAKIQVLALGTRETVGVAVAHAPAARIAASERFRIDGAPARNHGAIMLSKIMQPNAELGMNGQMGLPQR